MKPWLAKFSGEARNERPGRISSRHDQVVRYGSTIDAEAWRGAFVAAVRYEAEPEHLHAQLVSGIESQAWKVLRDGEGVRFRNFEHFCRTTPPLGLGMEPEAIRALLDKLLGKRRASIVLAPPSNQGTSCPRGKKSTRQDHRKRAIAERAPEPVRKLCQLGVVTYQQAEALAPARPSQEKVLEIERFLAGAKLVAESLGDEPSTEEIARAKRELRRLNPPTTRTIRLEVPVGIHQRLTTAAAEHDRAVGDLVLEGIALVLRYSGHGERLPEPTPGAP